MSDQTMRPEPTEPAADILSAAHAEARVDALIWAIENGQKEAAGERRASLVAAIGRLLTPPAGPSEEVRALMEELRHYAVGCRARLAPGLVGVPLGQLELRLLSERLDAAADALFHLITSPARTPQEWLKRAADAEDAAGSVSVGGLAVDAGLYPTPVAGEEGEAPLPWEADKGAKDEDPVVEPLMRALAEVADRGSYGLTRDAVIEAVARLRTPSPVQREPAITVRRMGDGWQVRVGKGSIPEILSADAAVEQVALRLGTSPAPVSPPKLADLAGTFTPPPDWPGSVEHVRQMRDGAAPVGEGEQLREQAIAELGVLLESPDAHPQSEHAARLALAALTTPAGTQGTGEAVEGRHFYAVEDWREMSTLMLDEWPSRYEALQERRTPVTLIAGHVGRDVSPPSPAPLSPDSEREYRCFHCNEAFTGEAARAHFGDSQLADAACSLDAVKYREMEALVARYQEEDTDLHRAINGLRADLHTQTRRAEEDGYAKGLADGRELGTNPAPVPAPSETPRCECGNLLERWERERGTCDECSASETPKHGGPPMTMREIMEAEDETPRGWTREEAKAHGVFWGSELEPMASETPEAGEADVGRLALEYGRAMYRVGRAANNATEAARERFADECEAALRRLQAALASTPSDTERALRAAVTCEALREFYEAYEDKEQARREEHDFTEEHEDEYGRMSEASDRERESELVQARHRATHRFDRALAALRAIGLDVDTGKDGEG